MVDTSMWAKKFLNQAASKGNIKAKAQLNKITSAQNTFNKLNISGSSKSKSKSKSISSKIGSSAKTILTNTNPVTASMAAGSYVLGQASNLGLNAGKGILNTLNQAKANLLDYKQQNMETSKGLYEVGYLKDLYTKSMFEKLGIGVSQEERLIQDLLNQNIAGQEYLNQASMLGSLQAQAQESGVNMTPFFMEDSGGSQSSSLTKNLLIGGAVLGGLLLLSNVGKRK